MKSCCYFYFLLNSQVSLVLLVSFFLLVLIAPYFLFPFVWKLIVFVVIFLILLLFSQQALVLYVIVQLSFLTSFFPHLIFLDALYSFVLLAFFHVLVSSQELLLSFSPQQVSWPSPEQSFLLLLQQVVILFL